MTRLATLVFLCIASMPAQTHEYLSFEELSEAFSWDLESTDITVETVAPGLHVMFGVGGNVVVSIGDQGVLMVDSQFPEMIPKISAEIAALGGGEIDFTINTHWHFDHADGNSILGSTGSWMVSQVNSRRMMAGSHEINLVGIVYEQPPYPVDARPVITYTDHMQFHFNSETIDLLHFGPAHTTGDTAVYFRDSNIVHMGDVFNASYPFIDAGNGGDLEGMIEFCRAVLAKLNAESIVVPGHGPVLDYADLAEHVRMLEVVRDRINNLIEQGKSLEEVLAAAPTREFDEKFGDPGRLIDRAYKSLTR